MNKKLTIVLGVILVILVTTINVIGITIKKNEENDNLPYKIEENIDATIYLEGMEEKVIYNKLKTKDFEFSFEPEYLILAETDDYYLFQNKTNKQITIKIEEIEEKDYNKLTSFISRNNMLIQYYYRTNNKKYYLITTSIPNDTEYIEGLGTRFIYLIDSFKLLN